MVLAGGGGGGKGEGMGRDWRERCGGDHCMVSDLVQQPEVHTCEGIKHHFLATLTPSWIGAWRHERGRITRNERSRPSGSLTTVLMEGMQESIGLASVILVLLPYCGTLVLMEKKGGKFQ